MNTLSAQGFEVIEGVLSSHLVGETLKELTGSKLGRSRAGMRKALEVDAVASLSTGPQLLTLARETLGEKAVPFRATLFDKSPEANWLVVWHQDTALPLRRRCDAPGWGPWSVKEGGICAHAPAVALEQVLAIRVHLDNSTTENGPLRVLPGTHKDGILTDEAIEDIARKVPLVECHATIGGVILMRPLLVHASSKSRSASPRRVLHIEYAANTIFTAGLEVPVPESVRKRLDLESALA